MSYIGTTIGTRAAKTGTNGATGRDYAVGPMPGRTTLVVQRYLDAIADDGGAQSRVGDLLDQAAKRLHLLCSSMLHRSYPRLARAPLNLEADDLLSAVVARLLKALRAVRPENVRQFFALAHKHMRWELNDLARRLDQHPLPAPIGDAPVAAAAETSSTISPNLRRILAAIEELPDDEREVFGLVRIQGLSHIEVAELLQVSTKTVQRRLNRGVLMLAQALPDLRPDEAAP